MGRYGGGRGGWIGLGRGEQVRIVGGRRRVLLLSTREMCPQTGNLSLVIMQANWLLNQLGTSLVN